MTKHTASELRTLLDQMKEFVHRPECQKRERLAAIDKFLGRLEVKVEDGKAVILVSAKTKDDTKILSYLNKNHLREGLWFTLDNGNGHAIYWMKQAEDLGRPPTERRSERKSVKYEVLDRLKDKAGSISFIRDDRYTNLMSSLNHVKLTGRRVIYLQHSNTSDRGVVSKLLNKHANVEMFLQDPRCSTPPEDNDRIRGSLRTTRADYGAAGGNLTVYLYNVPPTLRSLWVEGHFIASHCYVFLPNERGPRPNYEIQGVELPMTIAKAGTDEYEEMLGTLHLVTERMRQHAHVFYKTGEGVTPIPSRPLKSRSKGTLSRKSTPRRKDSGKDRASSASLPRKRRRS